ncbi:K02A2.6-like, partial [Cordylochernes scorpioides]
MSDHKRAWTAGKIKEMLDGDIITPSTSEYASPCILVPKTDSSYRLCIDYRQLNKETFLDPFPFPRIDSIINKFGGCRYFTKIDLKDGFWQVGLTKATRKFSAFVTPDGLYEFKRLPFGWKNSPPRFQRVMSEMLADLLELRVVVYIDDICCGAPTLEECASLTYKVLNRLNQYNMTVNLGKCQICVSEVELLGRIINGNSKQMKEEVIEKAKLMKRPYNLKSLQCFTGFTGHFRAYIPNYATIVRPLDNLKKKDSSFMWSDKCEEAYLKLIDIITSKPILAIPDESLPYEMSTDASYYGTGAILYQRDVNKRKSLQLRVISYYSYTFSKAEQNYSITEKECLAVLKAVKHFRWYLEGKSFVVHTDHRALTQLLSCGHLRDRLARWQLFLSSFEMRVNHRSGRELSDADALSRLAVETPNSSDQTVLFVKHQSIPLKLEDHGKYFVPHEHRTSILSMYHDDPLSGGHSGFWRTYYKMKQRFVWPGMKNDIRKYVSSCPICQRVKFKYKSRPSKMSLPHQSRVPFHTVHVDFAEAPSNIKDKNSTFLLLIDEATRVVQAKAMKQHGRALIKYFNEHEDLKSVRTIVSDQGRSFVYGEFPRWATSKDIRLITTSPYHPAGNGLAERAIRDIKTFLSCYPHFKGGWKNALEAAVRYHNRSYNSYLGCSPLFKLTKTSPVLPADKELNLHCPLYETEKNALEWFADEILSNASIKKWDTVKLKSIQRFGYKVESPIVAASKRRLKKEETVEDYFRDKIRLLNQTSLNNVEKLKMLTDGLPLDWKNYLVTAQPKDPSHWMQIAMEIEQNNNQIRQQQRRSVEVFLKIHSKLVGCKLHVVKNFSYPLLIGLDVAGKIGLIIDTKDKAVYVKGNECFYISPETHLPSVQQKELNQLLKENQALFSQHETDIGRIAVQHKIHTIEHPPISCRPYRRPLAEYDEIKRQVEELSKKGLIRESQSPWAFPVVLVSKKDGSQRMCIDYRKLNAITIDDKQPLPYIQDMFDRLHNAKYFTTLDIAWGYWHVEIHPDSVEKTAFITNDGHYEFLVMPFGLKNAPSTFQLIIQPIIGNLLWNGVCNYQDDILIYSSTFKDHIELMKKIFDKLKENNIKLKLKKCSFAKQEIRYLGHIIGHNKIKPDPEKTKAINEFPQPKSVKQVRQFLGLAGYYRKFIPKFSEIADPLTSLTRKNKLFKWTTEVNKSFQELKSHLSTDPVLSTYDPSLPCKLYTDASKLGIGAILAQIGNDNQEQVISYYSGKLLPHQQNYSAFELECFAVVQSVEYFEVYLENNTFDVITDHSALEWLFNVKKPKAKYLRWIIELSTKSMKIVHRSGSKQTHVDALSRSPVSFHISIPTLRLHQQKADLSFVKNSHIHRDLIMVKHNGVLKTVVPESFQEEILKEYHDNQTKCSHKPFIGEYVAPNSDLKPLELISMDTIVAGSAANETKHKYIQLIIDHLTRFVWAFPTVTNTSQAVIQCLDKINRTVPQIKCILTDNGKNFTSKEFNKFLNEHQVQHTYSTPYHPQSNGLCEKMNDTILTKLRTNLQENPRLKWSSLLAKIVKDYNSTPHDVTGFSPNFLLFGDCAIPEFSESPHFTIENARKKAIENSAKHREKWKARHDAKHPQSSFKVGDLVLRKIASNDPNSALEWYADEIISNPAIKRWEVVKEKLIQRFGSYNANPIVSASHRRLKREESIENYFQDKIRLLNQTHLTKEEKIHLLTDGLPNDWKDLIVAAQPTDTTKWFHIAASIEQNRASIQFKPKNKIHFATKNNDNRKNVCPFWCPICSKKGIKIKHWVTDCEDYDPNYKKDRPNQNTSVKQVCGAPELLNVSTLTNTPTQGAFKLINISVEVNGIPAQAFVDTGATVSIINWRLFKRTRLQLQPNSDIHISQADGVTRTCGSLQTKVRIDKLIKPVTLHVMKNFKYPLLIGLDVASLFNLLIDVRDKTIYTKIDGLQNPILVNHLEEIREHELKELLEHNRNVFSQHAIDLGKVAIQHKIITKSEQPISLRPYRRPLKEYEEIAEQVKELLEHKLIRTSDSPWAFPVVMVPKKDGNKRMCIDYRRLNEITLDDRQPLPHIQDMFDRLHGSRFFSTLDVAWGYWQIEMDPQSIQKTAFVTNDGHYEFLVMPFGLKNAASTFQRIIQHILGELLWKGNCSFQDDILVYTKTWQEHIELLSKVFDKLRQYNMKLKLSKYVNGAHLLPQVVKNYNSTPHDVTGFSPLFLMYGIGNVPEFADQTPITIEEARKKASLRTEQVR